MSLENSPAFRKSKLASRGRFYATGNEDIDRVTVRDVRACLYSRGYRVKRWLSLPIGRGGNSVTGWYIAEVIDRVTLEPRGFRSARFNTGRGKVEVSVTPTTVVLKILSSGLKSKRAREALVG